VKPYLIAPAELGTSEYDLFLKVPSYLRYVSSDGIEGAKPQALTAVGKEQEGGRSYTLYRATYKPYPGTGMELSLRWARPGGETIAYQPGLTAGGTFDWSHFTTTVRAPAGAALHDGAGILVQANHQKGPNGPPPPPTGGGGAAATPGGQVEG